MGTKTSCDIYIPQREKTRIIHQKKKKKRKDKDPSLDLSSCDGAVSLLFNEAFESRRIFPCFIYLGLCFKQFINILARFFFVHQKMAILFKLMKVSVLILLIIVAVHGGSLEEEVNYGGRKAMQKIVKSSYLLRELGFSLAKMKQSKRRALTDADRVAPGGPDHIHNTAPPAMR